MTPRPTDPAPDPLPFTQQDTQRMSRRSTAVGSPMLITLPTGPAWRDTHEGGMAFYLLVPTLTPPASRQACMAGYLHWPEQDAVIGADTDPPGRLQGGSDEDVQWSVDETIDAGLLIGSTGQSLFTDTTSDYFRAGVEDLTQAGRALYDLISATYGATPSILTLLDT